MQHYLMSLDTFAGLIFHVYLITGDEGDRLGATEMLLNEAEKHVGQLRMPVVLCTTLNLNSGVEIVEAHVQKYPEIKTMLAEAKAAKLYHLSMFAEDEVTSKELMELH
jgi:hypothetical protein